MVGESTAQHAWDWAPGVTGSATAFVDGRGRSVSTAILYEVDRAMVTLSPGDMIEVRTDVVPAVDSDVRAWCRSTGHELVPSRRADRCPGVCGW